MAKRSTQPEPVPVIRDSRTCYGIYYFRTEAEAAQYDKIVRKRGDTYNGGYFHGMACGRDKTFDYDDPKHGRLYAVTVA